MKKCLFLFLPLFFLPSVLLADSAEIKMLIAEEMRPAAMKTLKMESGKPPEVSISFFDTKDTALDAANLIVRVRQEHKAGKSGKFELDSVVKLRGAQPPKGFDTLEPEADWVGPEAVKASFSIKEEDGLNATLVADVLAGKEPVQKVLTETQQSFAAACFGKPVPWPELRRYGVIEVWKSKRDIGEFKDVTVELWKLTPTAGKPLELLEVSIKVKNASADEIKTNAAAFYAAASKAGLGIAAGASKTSQVINALKPGQ